MLNKKQLFTLFPLLIASTMANADWEGDAKHGQEKAYTCQFCHGATGYANVDGYPHINGQNAKYIYNAMLAYQKGERTNPMGLMMQQQMKPLSEKDIADIAAFYASQTAGQPE